MILFQIFAICLFWGFSLTSAYGQIKFPPDRDYINKELRTVNSLIRIGDFPRALAYLDNLKGIAGETPQIESLYKIVYLESKMYPELERLIIGQMTKSPGNPLLLAELGNVRFLVDDSRAADSLWNLALETGKNNKAVYIYVAAYKLRYGDYNGARDIYLRGRKETNDPALFSQELAGIFVSQGDYPDAVREYMNQLGSSPYMQSMISVKILGMMDDSSDPDKIISAVKAEISKAQSKDPIYELLGDLYIKQGKMKEAFAIFRDLSEKRSDDGNSLYGFAQRCFDFRAYSTAIEAVDEYLVVSRKKDRKESALLLKAISLRSSGQIESSLAEFGSLVQSAMDYRIKDEAGFQIGSIWSDEKDDCEQAINSWRTMLTRARVQEFRRQAMVELAFCEIKMNRYAPAETLLNSVITEAIQDQNHEQSFFLLGELALYRGDYTAAKDYYNQLVRKNPKGVFANNALSRLGALNNMEATEENRPYYEIFASAMRSQTAGHLSDAARILTDSRLEKSPIAQDALFYSAAFYMQAGENKEALGLFRRYIEAYPEGFYIDRAYLFTGDIYALNKETESKAREAYDRILELYSGGPVTELARERLNYLESKGPIG